MSTATLTRPKPFKLRGAAPIRRPLHTEKEYRAAVAEIDALVDLNPDEGTPESDRLELLSVLVEAYEDENEPIPTATPQEVVEYMAAQKGVTRTELAEILGGRSRLSEFLKEKRDLSIGQIAKLRDKLGIPADLLIRA